MKLALDRRIVTLPLRLAGLVLCLPVHAHAFSEPRSYFDDPGEGGGGGRWFTGSPAEGYSCRVCHTGEATQPLHVEGLPQEGYLPGASYDVRLAWPEFAARAQVLAQTPGVPAPGMGLVTELVSETGFGAGTLELQPAEAVLPGELCTFPPDARASQLYTVKSGADTEEVPTRCDASMLEERCLLTVIDCGAQELRFRWTAPDTWQRSIWFSVGFVATDASSDTPDGDAVTTLSFPIRPAASELERYESRLEGGCRIARPGARASGSARGLALAFGALLAVRASARRRRERA